MFKKLPRSADLQTTWTFLQEGIDNLMSNVPVSYNYAQVCFLINLGPYILLLLKRYIVEYGVNHRCVQLLSHTIEAAAWQAT